MANEAETVLASRQAAEKIIGMAQVELLEAAEKIAKKYKLPDGINGLTRKEFLGRLTFVVSMSRDLRVSGAEYLAREALKQIFDEADPLPKTDVKHEENKPPAADKEPKGTNPATDIEKLKLHPNQVRALKAAGIHQVGEIDKFTDEALLAINGIAPPMLAKIRASMAEFKIKGPPT